MNSLNFIQCLDVFKLETPKGIPESRERAKVRVLVFFRNPVTCKPQMSEEFLTIWSKKAGWKVSNGLTRTSQSHCSSLPYPPTILTHFLNYSHGFFLNINIYLLS